MTRPPTRKTNEQSHATHRLHMREKGGGVGEKKGVGGGKEGVGGTKKEGNEGGDY